MKFEDVKPGMLFISKGPEIFYMVFAKRKEWVFTLAINRSFGVTNITKPDINKDRWDSHEHILSSMELYNENGYAEFIKKLFIALKGYKLNIELGEGT